MNQNRTFEHILRFVFGDNIRHIYSIRQLPDDDRFEFEIRIADDRQHCSERMFSCYDSISQRLTEPTDDIIITYSTPSLVFPNVILRHYKYGETSQKKSLVQSFTTTSMIDNHGKPILLPLYAKVSIEEQIESFHECRPSSYARTYRQHLKFNDQSLSDWRIDKTWRMFDKTLSPRITQRLNPDNLFMFDMLDLEFEYTGSYKDFIASFVKLIETLIIRSPYNSVFADVCYNVIIFNSTMMNMFNIGLNDLPRHAEICLPSETSTCVPVTSDKLSIRVVDDGTMIIDDNVHQDGFRWFEYNLSVYLYAGEQPIDCYVKDNKCLTGMKYAERRSYFQSSMIQSDTKIYIDDDFRHIYLQPASFKIRVQIYARNDGVIMIKCADGTITSSLLDRMFSIGEYPMTYRIEKGKKIKLIAEDETDTLDTKREVENKLLLSYIVHHNLRVRKPKMTVEDIMFQVIVERYNSSKARHFLVESSSGYALALATKFVNADSVILRSSPQTIAMNMMMMSANEFIAPISCSRLIMSRPDIYLLHSDESLMCVPKIYKRDIDLALLSFRYYPSSRDVAELFSFINENISDKIVVNIIDEQIDNEFTYGPSVFKPIVSSSDVKLFQLTGGLLKTYTKISSITPMKIKETGLRPTYFYLMGCFKPISDIHQLIVTYTETRLRLNDSLTVSDLIIHVAKSMHYQCKIFKPQDDDGLRDKLKYDRNIAHMFGDNMLNYMSIEISV